MIGSSCIGASVMGGISNNSGGALIHRGPAYTQLALYARIDEAGEVQLVNHLGVRLGDMRANWKTEETSGGVLADSQVPAPRQVPVRGLKMERHWVEHCGTDALVCEVAT